MPKKKTSSEPSVRKSPGVQSFPVRSRASEYLAIIFFAAAVFLLLCLVSYDPRDPSFNVATARQGVSNLCGLVGSHIADALVQLLCLSAFVVPAGLIVLGLRVFMPLRRPMRWTEACSVILLVSGVSTLLERFQVGPFLSFPVAHPGGTVGTFLHASFFKMLGSAGEIVISVTLILLCVLHLSRVSLTMVGDMLRFFGAFSSLALSAAWARVKVWLAAREECRAAVSRRGYAESSLRERAPISLPAAAVGGRDDESCMASLDPQSDDVHSWERLSCLPTENNEAVNPMADLPVSVQASNLQDDDLSSLPEPDESSIFPWQSVELGEELHRVDSGQVTHKELQAAIEEYVREELSSDNPDKPQIAVGADSPDKRQGRPIRVAQRADVEFPRVEVDERAHDRHGDYRLPPSELLDMPEASGRLIDEKILESNAMVLEQKLADLGIKGEVVEVHPGPVITMFELALAPGIPLRKVLNTSDDLAMALKSGSTRVVAPIPGKDTVGIEVPNLNREIVYFREIIEAPAFQGSSAPLKIALGKGIDGEPCVSSLARMPHLLIAGATGTGKSVGLNCLICSWLMSCHPDDVKMIMVDPKKLELSYYQDIPHLIHPVVTDPEKVPKVLSWAIKEMERRYDLLSEAGAKNIESYNQRVLSDEMASAGDGPTAEKIPYLIIIVDELAELMMVVAKDIEISIARLAQMARAAGIHLILATQRPSVDVITGVIKANFPARISFQVSARPDSRTILDTTGAESLLGMGDMLFLPPGTAKMKRLHGALVSEGEIRRVVDFIKSQRSPTYLQEIAKHVSEEDSRVVATDLIQDEKYDEAVELVTRLGHASISLIQRHMRIGYNRAARIVEAMEAEGLIGPSDGTSRPREVLARSLDSIPDTC